MLESGDNMMTTLIDKAVLKKRIKDLAQEITKNHQGEKLTLICILKGSIYFFADLSRQIDLDVELEFMRISSYRGKDSTGEITLKLDLDKPITGKNVIIVEDIIDTGKTLSYLIDHLMIQNPKSLQLCTLLDKPKSRENKNIKVDYVGFTIPDYFVVGYGLDLDEKYRNIPEIKIITGEEEKAPQLTKNKNRN